MLLQTCEGRTTRIPSLSMGADVPALCEHKLTSLVRAAGEKRSRGWKQKQNSPAAGNVPSETIELHKRKSGAAACNKRRRLVLGGDKKHTHSLTHTQSGKMSVVSKTNVAALEIETVQWQTPRGRVSLLLPTSSRALCRAQRGASAAVDG